MAKGALKGNVQAFAALTDLIEVLVNVSRIKESKPYFKSGRFRETLSTKLLSPKLPRQRLRSSRHSGQMVRLGTDRT
jgi:hypothetical protein